jgi:hypothetical protein
MGVDMELLSVYMNDHITGATGGVGRLRRMCRAYEGTPLEKPLRRLAWEMDDEREWLMREADRLGFSVSWYKIAAAAVGERIARLKPNGRVTQRSPMSALLELELLRSAIRGKESGWQTLLTYADAADFDVQRLEALVEQAEEHYATVARLLEMVRPVALRD